MANWCLCGRQATDWTRANRTRPIWTLDCRLCYSRPSFELCIPGLHASRFSRINTECVHAPTFALVVYRRTRSGNRHRGARGLRVRLVALIVFSVALPVAAQITQASHSEPCLGLKLELDPHKIAELVLEVSPRGLPPVQESSAVYVTPMDASIVRAATRLMDCLAQPGDVELLAPLVIDEILIRLLRTSIGVRIAQMGFAESSVHRVAKPFPGCETTSRSP
jgi:hypothetical protein